MQNRKGIQLSTLTLVHAMKTQHDSHKSECVRSTAPRKTTNFCRVSITSFRSGFCVTGHKTAHVL